MTGERAGTAAWEWFRVSDKRFLFVDDTALVADSEELHKLESEFGKVCERRKLRGIKVWEAWDNENIGWMDVRLIVEPIE